MGLSPEGWKVSVSSDGLEASLTLTAAVPSGTLDVDDLRRALASAGIVSGIDDSAVMQLAQQPQVGSPVVIARGRPARDGKDEEIAYNFDKGAVTAAGGDDADHIDLRNLRNFNNTRAGTVIAEKKLAQPAQDGWTVKGAPVKGKPGRSATIKPGRGVTVSEDGRQARADVDGHACLVGDRVSCLAEVEIPRNVDFHVGNVHFVGSVRVRGNVLPGFHVEAGGNLEVQGNVEKAHLKAGGDLIIRGIVFGQGDCQLAAGGNAQCNSIDQATLRIASDLTVAGYLRHSDCLVGGKLELTGKRSDIIGGEVHAFRGVSTPYLGNQMATLTRIKVGSNPFVSGEIEQRRKQQQELERKHEQVQAALDGQRKRQAALGAGGSGADSALARLAAADRTLAQQLAELASELAALTGQLAEVKDARIRVSDIAYPGVVINFRDKLQYKTMDELSRLCFYEADAEIKTGPL